MLDWEIFFVIVVSLLVFDLIFLNKENKELSFNCSLKQSAFFVGSGIAFGVWIYSRLGLETALQYYNGYLIELALSVDNIFVISLIFAHFNVETKHQHRALFWGIIGAIFFRGAMISLGSNLVERFGWILDIFAAILIYTSIHLYKTINHKADLNNNKFIKFITDYIDICKKSSGNFIIYDKKWIITRTGVALCVIEFMDLVFAIDSIPAIFAITTNTYIVYSSNIFAIMGLRSMYFLLSKMIEKFKYLKYSLVLILFLIGVKIYAHHFVTFSPILPFVLTVMIFAAGIIASFIANYSSQVILRKSKIEKKI